MTVSVAVRVPNAVGVKAIPNVQLENADSVAPHELLEMAKSPGSVPENPTLVMLTVPAPVLFSVTD